MALDDREADLEKNLKEDRLVLYRELRAFVTLEHEEFRALSRMGQRVTLERKV